MKLSYPDFFQPILFQKGYFPSLVIENSALFYRFVHDLYCQSHGDDGAAVLSKNDTPITIAGNLNLLTDFFSFEINHKNLLNKIIASLEKQALSPEFYNKTQLLLGQVENLLYDIAFQDEIDVIFSHLSFSSLLKATGPRVKEDYQTLAEKILVYMDLMTMYGLAEIFVLVNCRSVLDLKNLDALVDTCCKKEYRILLVDSTVHPKLLREQRTIIDNDLCEI